MGEGTFSLYLHTKTRNQTPMTDHIITEKAEDITTIRLDRPRQKNAIALAGWQAIPAHIACAEADPDCRVIVLRGADGNFGAGADIAEFAHVLATPDQTLAYFAAMESAMQAFEHARKPVVAVVEGLCIGACVALSLACDIRIVSTDAIFAVTPARLGIAYPYGDVRRLLDALGPGRTKSLLFSGRRIDAHQAEIFGLVDHLVPAATFEADLAPLLHSITTASLWTITASKQAVRALLDGQSAASAGYPEHLATTVTGPDFIEGTTAFREKRAPRFTYTPPA